eukprot:TRINITY_DN775933_c0_g1_i1.p1 TRINITY_DN775933_c0_g1~~TRINITY_DN775933_c0_g1_i1.p1  ORF type:complete len:174 (-),score=58.98 TRINITY_DN775933_c0_g1_i1:261-782(-)
MLKAQQVAVKFDPPTFGLVYSDNAESKCIHISLTLDANKTVDDLWNDMKIEKPDIIDEKIISKSQVLRLLTEVIAKYKKEAETKAEPEEPEVPVKSAPILEPAPTPATLAPLPALSGPAPSALPSLSSTSNAFAPKQDLFSKNIGNDESFDEDSIEDDFSMSGFSEDDDDIQF